MDVREQRGAAARRYRGTTDEREDIVRRQESDGVAVVDVPEQVEARAQRLAHLGHLSSERVLALLPREGQAGRNVLLERIIGSTSDFQAVNFLSRGARAARTIGRISEDRASRHIPVGTGFLVSARLLLTNNHVLPDADAASRCLVEFNCEIDLDYKPGNAAAYRFDPDALFVTDERLDYTLVALHPGSDGRPAGEEFGWNTLIPQQGKIVTGERVNIAGHPMGRLKEIAIRSNALQNQLEQFLHYDTDTEPGNSGSPVFNDQWEVVALHHAGVPSTDAENRWLKADGSVWHPDDGDDAVAWVANEGTRVSVLMRDVASRTLPPAQREVLAELSGVLDVSGPGPVTGADASATTPDAAAPNIAITDDQAAPAQTVDPGSTDTPATGDDAGSAPVTRSAEAMRAGAPARRSPRGADGAALVFLHGRGQAGRDPVALRARWAGGLARGLGLAGLPGVDAAHAWFPFYGDVLARALSAKESIDDPDASPAERYAPDDASTRAVYAELLEEAARDAGMPPGLEDDADPDADLGGSADESVFSRLVAPLQGPLGWLANRSGLDERLIAAVFRDVAAYLDREPVREKVLAAVRRTLPASGRMVLVSHSLGTVVAMDLIAELPPELDVVHLVTAGSPLGMDGVFSRLRSGGPKRPERVGTWLNAWCPADAVAIGCPLADDWGNGVREVVTAHDRDRAHDIEEYLADIRVARSVGRALTPPG